jgi:thiamine biosynthesis protein ThiS
MLVKLNGKESDVTEFFSLQDLVQSRGLKKNMVIIELNGEIIRREQWDRTRLKSNDSLEIIQIIGGG